MSLCPSCVRAVEPERVVVGDGGAWMHYRCPDHRSVPWQRWYPTELIEQGA